MTAEHCRAQSLPRLLAELRETPKPAARELLCPFEPAIHESAADIQSRSVDWARACGLVSGKKAEGRAAASRIGRLVARALPRGEKAWVQIAADWTTLFCLLDDHIERLDGPAAVSACLAGCAEALGTGRRAGESALLGACASLHERMRFAARPGWMGRFLRSVDQLFAAFAAEAEVRRAGEIPGLEAYLPMREVTVGVHVELAIGEMACGVVLSEAARRHPVVVALARKASNIVGWANDIFTYQKELADGEVTNLVIVLASAEQLPLGRAVDRAVAMHDDEVRSFLSLCRHLPRLDEADDRALRTYVDMLRTWVRGHLDWAHETGRYDPRRELARSAAPAQDIEPRPA